MKILFIIAHFAKSGGQSVQAKRLIDELSKNNEIKVLCLNVKNENYLDLPKNTEVVGDLIFPKGIFQLLKKINEIGNNYDIVQVFDSYFALPAVYLSKIKKPIVLRLGADPLLELRDKKRFIMFLGFYFLEKLMFRKVDFFIVNNTHYSSRIMKRKNLIFIPNGFYPINIKKKKDRKEFVLLYTGHVSRMKDIEFIVSAMQILKNCYLYIVGDISGEYRDYYQYLIKNYDTSNIEFVGKIHANDIKNYAIKSDVFVFPSLKEGFPNSVLEAMFFGLPVVCRNIPGIINLIYHEQNGFLFNNKKEYIENVNKLKSTKKLREKIIKNSFCEIRKKYIISEVAKKYYNIYESLVS